jgi:hypothetical protein
MGIAFTIDTPLKVAQYGIDSVISLVDDVLLERLRKSYSEKFDLPYSEIDEKEDDFRSKRITSYLNMMQELTQSKFQEMRSSVQETGQSIQDYFRMLPDYSDLKREFQNFKKNNPQLSELREWINDNLSMGHIDVNIMSKVDKPNFRNKEALPSEYNDAHAALRGFAQSDLSSTLVLSAGMNPRLYSYLEAFEDFYPDAQGFIKKRVALKVSDYRSAAIQGKFLAKKGIWVSEYRIESGLNCGGHAFATDGFLMGPILAEFRDHRSDLEEDLNAILKEALEKKGRIVPSEDLQLKITAQGGVGTHEEHQFLINHYGVDSVGWGTPFLLVPEVTTLDDATRNQLVDAREEDLELSKISPLGVPFNNLKGNSKDVEKQELIDKGRMGSSCPKKYLVSNTEFTDRPICTASRQYQHLKMKTFEAEGLDPLQMKEKQDEISVKSCICVGLGTPALLENDLDTRKEGPGVSVCPGPNMAYFDKKLSLAQMSDHIYGRANYISRDDRPHMFVKELNLYIDYLKEQITEATENWNAKQEKYVDRFYHNLQDGIRYYNEVFDQAKEDFQAARKNILNELRQCEEKLLQVYELSPKAVTV